MTHYTGSSSMFANPFLHALLTEHAMFAIGTGLALRYPAEVIPFAALAEPTREAMLALAALLAPGEIIYLTGDHIPAIPEIEYLKELPCWQYHLPPKHLPPQQETPGIRLLTADDSTAMITLTDVAFPGYFRPRAHLLGPFYGIHAGDDPAAELIAMAGTRICLPGYREISAICTHPAHVGQGQAAALTRHILRANAAAGLRSFLHVLIANHRAIALYERLGFERTIPVLFHQLRRR